MSEPYNVGTISVSNGGTTVTGVETYWIGAVFKNDMLMDPASGLQSRVTEDPTSNTELTINPWPGSSLTDAAYEIIPAADTTTSSARLRDLLAQMSVVQANGRGLFFRFSDSVTDADPGSGYLRFNNATVGSSTGGYLDNLDANGASVASEIDTWDDSTSIIRGRLWVRSIADPSAFHAFSVTGSVVDGTGYRKLTLTYVGGSGGFADGEELMVFFVPKGDQGDSFEYDEQAPDLAGLAAYDDEDPGFVVLVLDDGEDPSRSAFFTMGDGGAGDWSLTAYLTGPIGPAPNVSIGTVTTVAAGAPADAEITGTNPNFVLNLDIPEGERGITWQGDYSGATAYVLDDGVLYNGSSWRALQATTGNAPPTLPTTSNAYWQLLARQGIDGAGTVNSIAEGANIEVDASDPTAPIVGLAFLVSSFAKTLLDDTTGAAAFATMGATETKAADGSVTFPNGIILKWGQVTPSGGNATVVYGSAFPTRGYPFLIPIVPGTAADEMHSVTLNNYSASGFVSVHRFRSNAGAGNAGQSALWFAIGY